MSCKWNQILKRFGCYRLSKLVKLARTGHLQKVGKNETQPARDRPQDHRLVDACVSSAGWGSRVWFRSLPGSLREFCYLHIPYHSIKSMSSTSYRFNSLAPVSGITSSHELYIKQEHARDQAEGC